MDKGWRFRGNELNYVKKTLESGFTALDSGTMNETLEENFASAHNSKYAVSANSGTSTLHMALEAFGVGENDEVLMRPSLH